MPINYPSNMNLHTTSYYVKDKIPLKPKNPYNRILIVGVVELLKEVTQDEAVVPGYELKLHYCM